MRSAWHGSGNTCIFCERGTYWDIMIVIEECVAVKEHVLGFGAGDDIFGNPLSVVSSEIGIRGPGDHGFVNLVVVHVTAGWCLVGVIGPVKSKVNEGCYGDHVKGVQGLEVTKFSVGVILKRLS